MVCYSILLHGSKDDSVQITGAVVIRVFQVLLQLKINVCKLYKEAHVLLREK